MADKSKDQGGEQEPAAQPTARPGRLDRPQKQKPTNRLMKPNGRTGSYETK